MSHKKAITKAAIVFAAALFALSFPLTALAEPEYSTDGTCVGPGCHTEDELPDLVGHSGGAQQATQAPEIAQIEGAEYFTATSKGFGGDVEVTIAVKDGKIAAMIAYGPKETSGIGSNAVERLPGEIVAAQSWEVEAVSGATMTSMAIREAAKAAMTEAGLVEDESAAPAPATETPEAPEEEEPEGGVDMVIIAIGAAFIVLAGGVIFFSGRRKD